MAEKVRPPSWPADNFGVFIENERDRLRVEWLVVQIGEEKLRSSVAKYHRRYPDDLPFVSLLLKWHRLTVPTSVYLPKRVSIFGVYLLVDTHTGRIKVGMSRNWTIRATSFVKRSAVVGDRFDLDRSIFVDCGTQTGASDAERSLLHRTSYLKCDPPPGIPWGAWGKTEWRHGGAYAELLSLLLEQWPARRQLSLREALQHEVAMMRYPSVITPADPS